MILRLNLRNQSFGALQYIISWLAEVTQTGGKPRQHTIKLSVHFFDIRGATTHIQRAETPETPVRGPAGELKLFSAPLA
jgi:hypothetical protein